jgi:GAF domain-containing protein
MGDDFSSRVAAAAREMAEEPTLAATVQRAVGMCTQALTRCDMAGVSVAESDRVRTLAASSERLRMIDDLQFQTGEGPCFDTLSGEEAITSNDLATDSRWPNWGPLVSAQAGVHASLSYRLAANGKPLGALNIYSAEPGAFTHQDLVEGYVLAAHAAAALASSIKEAQLAQALETRTVIGQATGILMERFGLDDDAAFGVLRRLSQTHNVKIVTLATDLVDHGTLPGNGFK